MTEVSAGGIRSGEPDALAGLCRRRGGAVLMYSEHVAAPGQAADAAADAFAQFRARVVAAEEATIDAEALLLSATRHAAKARGTRARPENGSEQHADCPTEALLIDWIEETLSAPDRERFEQHVVDCPTCVDAVARFEAAERAYEHPPLAPLPPKITQQILGALVAAAPVTALEGDAAAVREAAEKGAGVGAPAASPAAVQSVDADTLWPDEPVESTPAAVSAMAWPEMRDVPAGAADVAPDRPSPNGSTPLTPAYVRHDETPTIRSSAAARAAGAGDAMIELFRKLGERGRQAAQHRPRLPQGGLRLPQGGLRLPPGGLRLPQGVPRFERGIGRRPAIGVALGGVVALIIAIGAVTLGGSSTSGESASSVSDGSPPNLTPTENLPGAVADEPPAAAEKKPESKERKAAKAKARSQARRQTSAAAEARAQRADRAQARARRAERRRSAPSRPSKQRSPAPSNKPEPKKPEPKKPEPTPPKTPTAKRPKKEPTPAPAPEPARPEPPSPRPSLGGDAPTQQAPSLGSSK